MITRNTKKTITLNFGNGTVYVSRVDNRILLRQGSKEIIGSQFKKENVDPETSKVKLEFTNAESVDVMIRMLESVKKNLEVTSGN